MMPSKKMNPAIRLFLSLIRFPVFLHQNSLLCLTKSGKEFVAFNSKTVMAINTAKYAEEANIFVKQVAQELGNPADINHAGRVTVAVLHTLREKITVPESIHLISQLPMILKGVYVDGWDISREMSQSDTLDEFLDELRQYSQRTAGRDFGDNQQAADHVKAVLRVMRNYVSEGEMRHIKEQMPGPLKVLFE